MEVTLIVVAILVVVVLWLLRRAPQPVPPGPPVPPPPPPPTPPSGIRLSVVVRSSAYPTGDVAAYVTAQQAQISGEFAPAFGIGATVAQEAAGPGSWPIYLDDRSDAPGALGYHDVDAQGIPFARVFLLDSQEAGVAWQTVASHEVLEILADPTTTRTAIGLNGRPWAYEVGDPVEDVEYLINGVPVSDFVFPGWFDPFPTSVVPVDDRHAITHPYQITAGGYAQYQDKNGNWVQVSGPSARKARK